MRTVSLPHAELQIFADAKTLSRAGADKFLQAAHAAIASHGRFTVALSGGSTPKAIFALLSTDQASGSSQLAWDKVQIFFGDERHVPPDHAESNFRMATEALLSKVPIPSVNIHRVQGELDAAIAAANYEQELRRAFGARAAEVPKFDLIMLGMGPDGHTASLFPGTTALKETSALVCSTWVEKLKSHRITFTYTLLNAAAEVLFIAGGADKAGMLRNVLRGHPSSETYPAQGVRPANGKLIWMVDEAAAGAL